MSKDKDEKLDLTLEKTDGAIIFREGFGEEYFVAPSGDDLRSKDIRASIAFYVYATQKEDWVQEFNEYMVRFYEAEEALDKKRRDHLKIIK